MPNPESAIVKAIRGRSRRSSKQIRLGVGDDCAVIRPRGGEELVVTTDMSVEGVHFRRDWDSPKTIGHRSLARGLSDIAAVGARPMAAFLSIALPEATGQRWLDEFLEGFLSLADRFGCVLAGGDTSTSLSGVTADVTVLGAVRRGRAILRAGARANDIIYVTGALGGAAAALSRRQKGEDPGEWLPEPRIAVADFLRRKKIARSLIDVSDGLSVDLAHVARESAVKAVVNSLLVPVAGGAALEQALHGGEDYELLFTAASRTKVPVEIAGVAVTEIGWIERGTGVFITDLRGQPKALEPRAWQHFRS